MAVREAIAFACGGLCGVGALVVAVFLFGGENDAAPRTSSQFSQPVADPGAPQAEIVSGSTPLRPAPTHRTAPSRLSGTPSPWEWRRWLELRKGQTRADVRSLLGEERNPGAAKGARAKYDLAPSAVTKDECYWIEFRNGEATKWSVPHLPTSTSNATKYENLANWDGIKEGSSTLDDVLKALGDPTALKGNEVWYRLLYETGSGSTRRITIKRVAEVWRVTLVEIP